MTPPRRRARLLVPLAFVASALLALPSLSAPLFEDDVFHRAMLLDRVAGLHWGSLELYDFVGGPSRPARVLRERGLVPWFADDNLKIRFFRPLSSATLALDARLFGARTWPARLHSLCWFLCILGLVTALHRRFLSPPSAGLATLIYALSVGHAMPIVWIAARHTLVSSAFALFSSWLYLRGRNEGWRIGRWLAPVAFIAGLSAGEMALGVLAIIGAQELAGRTDAFHRRIRALAPFGLITVVYLGAYAAFDYGARGSGAYLGLDDGLSSVLVIIRRWWILAGELVAGTPSDAVTLGTAAAQRVAACWGAASVLIAWAVVRVSDAYVDARERRAVGWMVAASAAAALPGTVGLPGGRVLTLALVPGSAVLAVVLLAGAALVRDGARRLFTRAAVAIAISGFALVHLVGAPLLRVAIAVGVGRLARAQHEQANRIPSCPGMMVLVATDDPTITMYMPATLSLQGGAAEPLRVLSMAADDHRIENVTRTGFDLTTGGRARERTTWERLFRGLPMPAGTRVTIAPFDVTVLEDRGGIPVRTRFDFREPLESSHLCFLQWGGDALVRLQPPRVGGNSGSALPPWADGVSESIERGDCGLVAGSRWMLGPT